MTTEVVERLDKIITKPEQVTEDDLRLLETLTASIGAPEPEAPDKVVHRGDEQNPAPMVRTPTKSAGHIFLRRNSDGKMVQINKNQLIERLKQKLADGRAAWLTPNAPWGGRVREPKFWCPLSANHSDRKLMDEFNLPVCEKRGKLATRSAVERHFKHKHRDAYEAHKQAVEELKQDKRDRQMELQTDALVTALSPTHVLDMALDKNVPVRRAADILEAKERADKRSAVSVTCEVCKAEITATHRLGLAMKVKAHKRKEHQNAG